MNNDDDICFLSVLYPGNIPEYDALTNRHRAQNNMAIPQDPRVAYLGEIPRNKLLAYQKDADLLINPRINAGIFTRYSFPSKNMEYMSSGTPMVGYKLEGIPEEYDNYINYFAEPTAESIASCIVKLYHNYDAAKARAASAQEYVRNTKNKHIWGQKILQFMEQF